MRKVLFIIVFSQLLCWVGIKAQSKVGFFIGYEHVDEIVDDDERAAVQWFQEAYPSGVIFTPSTIATLSKDEVKALWVMTDRVDIGSGWSNMPAPFISSVAIKAIADYVKDGGNLLLTNHATQLLVPMGRLSDIYAPAIFGAGEGGQNPDVWGVNAVIGTNMAISYDHRSHRIFGNLATSTTDAHEFYPLIGNGWKEDHNSMWDFNAIAGLEEMPSKLSDFEIKTNSIVLGTWQHVTDYACAGLIEFLPCGDFKGRVLANGIAAYEWNQNDHGNEYLPNIKTLTANCLNYLSVAMSGSGEEVPLKKVVGYDMTLVGTRYMPTPRYITEEVSGANSFVYSANTPANVEGAKGKALRMDGYSTYVNANIDNSKLSDKAISFSVWVAPETYPMMNIDLPQEDYAMIAGNINSTFRTGFAFEVSNRGHYRFRCFTGGYQTLIDASATLPRYEWSHLVATIDAANCKVTVYNNGAVVGSAACYPTINIGDNPLLIGKSSEKVEAYGYDLNVFNGLIDDVAIYNGVLSQDIIRETSDQVPDMNYPASHYANDIYRPSFHGMPTANWTNETHGAVYYNGKFHVFFQKCANGNYLAHINWGHIYSDNLYEWKEDRTAVSPDDWFDMKGCWSGCLFSNADFNDGKPTILYTGVDFGKARICEASPLDEDLTNWSKQGPVIDGCPGGLSDDFRDPYFFSKDGKDYIIVGSAKNGIGATTLHRYDKESRTWSNDGSMFFQGVDASINGSFWEMPNVTPLGDKWLFTATPMESNKGVRTVYWTGDIADDGKFIPTSSSVTEPQSLELSEVAHDGYGLLSPTIFTYEGKTLLLGIVPDKGGIDNYHEGWAHTYSLPREINLSADGRRIEQRPYSGLEKMRTDTKWEKSAFDLDGIQSLAPVSGRKFEIRGNFKVGKSAFGFNFLGDGEKCAKLYYSPNDNTVTLDISQIDRLVNDGDIFNGIYRSELPEAIAEGDVVTLHVFMDNSIADIFVNDKWAFSVRLYPSNADADQIEAFTDGNTRVISLGAWVLDTKSDAMTNVAPVTMVENMSKDTNLYNMAGQRVGKNYKGLVIRNGKKILIK